MVFGNAYRELLVPQRTANTLQEAVRRFASKRARLREPHPRFHDLRHPFTSLLMAGGANASHVQGQLGHAGPGHALRIYTHEFNKAAHEETTRAALDAVAGNSLVTSAPKTEERSSNAP
jgi:integrase